MKKMEIEISTEAEVPVMTLKGRFDGLGAKVFDARAQQVDAKVRTWILDLGGVDYMSSIGIRSILQTAKLLRTRAGGLVLARVTPFVRQILETSGLLKQLRIVDSVAEGLASSRESTGPGATMVRATGGRDYQMRPWVGSQSAFELWGNGGTGSKLSANDLVTGTLEHVGLAFGLGAFGSTRQHALVHLGQFLSCRNFAGTLPPESNGVADFQLAPQPADVTIHIQDAVGIAGNPTLVATLARPQPIPVATLVADAMALASTEGHRIPAAAFIISATTDEEGLGIFAVGVTGDREALRDAPMGAVLTRAEGSMNKPGAQTIGLSLAVESRPANLSSDLQEYLRELSNLDKLNGLSTLDPEIKLAYGVIWLYCPDVVRSGTEKLQVVESDDGAPVQDEWVAIMRRLYADCSRVRLTQLPGGFMSKTFRVTSFDNDGRRQLPTVVKLGPEELTRREEQANRNYVQKFILNNSTTILGMASHGDWAGLRYNFLGISGPDSSLSWLHDHYMRRPLEETLPLFQKLFRGILKPWYGQPRWEPLALYADHSPLHLFPDTCKFAETNFGFSADEPEIECPELGCRLPNPFHFLKFEYEKRKRKERLWYTSICHGDLNMRNILVDERENIYVIDFSETHPRNVVSDFARMEPIFKFETLRLESEQDLAQVLVFEDALTSITQLCDVPKFTYAGSDPMVEKAYRMICELRRNADIATLFETDPIPYWLAVLEWTYSCQSYGQLPRFAKKYAAYSAALIVRSILKLEGAGK
jgi:anti-anti-sigma factor